MVLWSRAFSERLSFRTWNGDDLSVVYNPVTGDTHLLEWVGGECLRLIDQMPSTARELAVELAQLCCEGERQNLPAAINATLAQLRDIGLVVDGSQ